MGIEFIDKEGTFCLEKAQDSSYLYFPIANEGPVMSSITPNLHGDSKMDQNTFLLEPVSAENLHSSLAGRNFWCKIEGELPWSAAGDSAWQKACRGGAEADEIRVTAGKLWHSVTVRNTARGLSSEILNFCPATKETVEVMRVTIKNIDSRAKNITPITAIPIYGRSADNFRDHRHVTSLLARTIIEENGITVTPTLSFDERGHKENKVSYSVFANGANGELPVAFCPVMEDFIGEGGTLDWPKAVLSDKADYADKDNYDGYEVMGGIWFAKRELKPDESMTFYILLSYNKDGMQYLKAEQFEKGYRDLKEYWKKQEMIQCVSGDKNFDMWMGWVGIQPTLRRIYGCSFMPHHDYGRGGRGWRDLWQDSLALILLNPQAVRENLISYFGGVRIDGSNATIIGKNPGEFIADRNSIVRMWMDHGVWPLITIHLYIEQTGDYNILLEENTYFKDKVSHRGEREDEQWEAGDTVLRTEKNVIYQGNILEHLLVQNLTAFYDVGMHNHIRLRGADWNDALDMAVKNGESVAFTAAYSGNLTTLANLVHDLSITCNLREVFVAKEIQMLINQPMTIYPSVVQKKMVLDQYCDACCHNISGEVVGINLKTLEENLRSKAEWIQYNIRKKELVGDGKGLQWFNGYYDNHKEKVEGIVNGEVRMMLTGQVFAIMSGTATDEQIATIVKAADKYLYSPEIGGYRLNTNFNEVKTDLGRMFGFAYGHKENGAVFSHMAVMYSYSLYKKGFAREGYKVIMELYKQAMDFDKSHIYPGIPEYYNERGRGMYHYLTGAASWAVLTVLNEMYGVKGERGNLWLQPKLLAEQFDEQGEAAICSFFADRWIKVVYINSKHQEIGDYDVEEIFVDGEPYEFELEYPQIDRRDIINLSKNEEHEIRVILS